MCFVSISAECANPCARDVAYDEAWLETSKAPAMISRFPLDDLANHDDDDDDDDDDGGDDDAMVLMPSTSKPRGFQIRKDLKPEKRPSNNSREAPTRHQTSPSWRST